MLNIVFQLLSHLQFYKIYMREKRERSRSADKVEDPNKLYIDIYNIPEHFNKEDIVYFLWKTLEKCKALKKHTNPVTKSQHIQELSCIRVYLRSREQTLNTLDLNGIYYGSKPFYMKSPIMSRDIPQIDINNVTIRRLSPRVQEGFNKLCIQNPPSTSQFEIVNFLSEVGDLKSFQAVYNGKVISHCFFEYKTSDQTENSLNKLNSLKLKGKQISVKRAALMTNQASKTTITKVKSKSSLFQKDISSYYLTFDTVGFFKKMKISCILLLKGIISLSNEKQFIKQDIRKELEKIGPISKIVTKEKNMYIQYEKVEYAQICFLLLKSRKYEGKPFEVSFYDPLNFADDILV